jgi:hypothetical protein
MICKVVDQQVEAHTLITTHGAIAGGQQPIHIKEDHQEYPAKVQEQAVLYSAVAIFAHTVCSVAKPTPAAAMPAEVSTGS